MNTDLAIYLMLLIGLFLGFLFATLEYKRKLRNLKKRLNRRNEIEDLAIYTSGWNSALNNHDAVKKAHRYLFENLS